MERKNKLNVGQVKYDTKYVVRYPNEYGFMRNLEMSEVAVFLEFTHLLEIAKIPYSYRIVKEPYVTLGK